MYTLSANIKNATLLTAGVASDPKHMKLYKDNLKNRTQLNVTINIIKR